MVIQRSSSFDLNFFFFENTEGCYLRQFRGRLEAKNGDTVVVFKCQEIFTILPIIEGGASEGNKWIRLGVEDENGLGKGIRTIAFYQYNDRHSYLLKQFYPLLYKNLGLGQYF